MPYPLPTHSKQHLRVKLRLCKWRTIKRLAIHTCHFFSPPALSPAFDGARLAILGSCVLEYSCARAAHTFLCVLKCAFWQSLLQYATLWHLVQSFNDCSALPHCAHAAVCDACCPGLSLSEWTQNMQ
jgi:hypothetical protein